MAVAHTPSRKLRHRRVSLPAALLFVAVAVGVALLIRHDVHQDSTPSGTVEGSGIAATQVRALPSFNGVELRGSNNVFVHVGRSQTVTVHADDNLLRHVTTRVNDGRLVIGNTPGSFSTTAPMSVDVTVRSLDAVTLTGSGTISVNGIDASTMTATLAGSGVLRLGGSTQSLDITVAGSGDAQLAQLRAAHVTAVVAGSGRILVTATKSLDAVVPGTGTIVYRGSPATVSTNVTGIGSVTPAR